MNPSASDESGDTRRTDRGRRPGTTLTVCAQHSLVGEAVAAALVGEGLDPTHVPWRDLAWWTEESALPVPVLLLGELDDPTSRDELVAGITAFGPRCLLLTSTPEGPAWGAALHAGAGSVLHSGVPVDRLAREVRQVASGVVWTGSRRDALVVAWRRDRDAVAGRRARLARLTLRERTVLELLHVGNSVDTIAELLDVSEATVRAQVRRVLRKLELTSQLAAVAAYDEHRRDPGDGGRPVPPIRSGRTRA